MTDTNNGFFPCQVSIVVTSAAQLAAVYALLGGVPQGLRQVLDQARASTAGAATAAKGAGVPEGFTLQEDASQDTDANSGLTGNSESSAPNGNGSTATNDASPSDGEVDAHGHPWSADLHASTRGKTKDGLWRMKVGVTRPDPKPGFPVESGSATGTTTEKPSPSATSQTATAAESAPVATSTADEEDEFAAFRNAAAASDDADKAAAAAVPARTFTDADLGALCNQAAVKLGDPSPIKEIIANFVPEGQVAHSRNIPEDRREEFASAVEAKADIKFAG